MTHRFSSKDIVSIEGLSKTDIETVLKVSDEFLFDEKKRCQNTDDLKGKTVVNLFFENSTRTRASFEIAAKRLSAHVVTISEKGSSAEKGETLLDTAKNIEAMQADIIVCRHSSSGASQFLANALTASVINAGDGAHEHPSQALLDVKTILLNKGKILGLKIVIVGDIAHSRVVRSNIHALTKMGAHVVLVAPYTMMPLGIEKLGVEVSCDLDKVIKDADVVMMLRIQHERMQASPLASLSEYARFYGLNALRVKKLKPDVLIMHPGPVNRGVELDFEVCDSSNSAILKQVSVGVAVRMAMLKILSDKQN